MSNEPISYDQLRVMMEIQSKNTEQMVLVADRLKEIAETNKDIASKATAAEDNKKTLVELKTMVISMAKQVTFLMIIYTALTGLVAIAFLIVQVVSWSTSKKSTEDIQAQNAYLKKIQTEGIDRGLLQEQIKQAIDDMQNQKGK